jgi:hypothetical protein
MKSEIKIFFEKSLALAISSLVIAAIVVYYQYKVVGAASFHVNAKKNVLVLGDSHTECALNDSVLTNYLNISQSAEPYFYSFLKLKKFVNENSQIDTVLLGFNFMSLTKDFERRTLSNEFIYSRAQKYFPFFELSDFVDLLISKPSFFISILNQSFFARLILHKQKTKLSFSDLELGGYLSLLKYKLCEDIDRSKVNIKSKNITEQSDRQIEYLTKIISFCKERNIKILLFNTPIYSEAKQFCDVKAYYKYYHERLNDIPLLDYSSDNLPAGCYGDIEHLNSIGAKIFSEKLKLQGLKTGAHENIEEFQASKPNHPDFAKQYAQTAQLKTTAASL